MEREVHVRQVEEAPGRSATTRFVLRDDEGNEYTTFRPHVGEEARRWVGQRPLISFHEEERRGFHNVYLDGIAAPRAASPADGRDEERHADESAWGTALEAAPWIVGTPEPREAVPPRSSTSGYIRSKSSSRTTSADPTPPTMTANIKPR